MTLFTSSHDLQDTPAPAGSRSTYAYLFPDLADAPEAGRFQGTDDAGTLQRLKDFETACHLLTTVTPEPGLTIDLPAAYTYFCQFLNHDISAPVGSVAANLAGLPPVGIIGSADPIGLNKDWRADVATILSHIANEQARPMTLGSLYGEGPSDPESAALYDGAAFRLGLTSVTEDQTFDDRNTPADQILHASGAPDIPRAEGLPLIADRRNDGNLILSQLHLAFMLFHNKAVKALTATTAPDQVFARARALVTLHYHWLILNDVLPAILSRTVLTKPLSDWQPRPMPPGAVPMEFTTAAFRFGHSMVGRSYDYNANFGRGSLTAPQGATLGQLFAFTSKGKMGDEAGPDRQLPDHWVIDWDRMTDPAEGDVTGRAERIDLDFAPEMLNVAGNANILEQGSILFRNLLRGFHRRMPFGQRLAEACGVALLPRDALRAAMPQHRSADDETFPNPTAAAEALGLLDETPAWLYFLCEAQELENGRRVGPTASQIIADTIVGLMQGDPASLLAQAAPWHPSQSLLKDAKDQPITSLRSFLMFATDGG